MVRQTVTLDDKYTEQSGRIYLNGLQALVRLPMIQQQLDKRAELNTSSLVSGYRGSPLGGLDIAFSQAEKFWERYNLVFQSGINEELAATAIWGSQQLHLNKQKQYDGVTGFWYGKGSGVDRSLDALKHANAAGTSPNGGVLALVGDDHSCKSSTLSYQSEQAFIHAMIPIIHPAGIADALILGLHGIAMSRFSGCWVAMKVLSDMADSSASIFTDPFNIDFKIPNEFEMPDGGLNIRENDNPIEQEKRLLSYKLPAIQEYTRVNKLDYTVFAPEKKMRLAIVTTGKSYMDTLQAFEEMGLSQDDASKMGIGLYKVSVVWPLEPTRIQEFADGAEEILVIEEKRSLIENQLKQVFYDMPVGKRPRICGKLLLAENYELSPTEILKAIISRLSKWEKIDKFIKIAEALDIEYARKFDIPDVRRIAHYCSGCPHNISTKVPEDSRALSGGGCHSMATSMDRNTDNLTQMGGEGVPWIGQAPFTKEQHVFANIGDGTYFHSGVLAIRAALAANVNITYKILYNDAVAMTGGQSIDGKLSVDMMARQLAAEGVERIVVMSDDVDKYDGVIDFPTSTSIEHRDDLEYVQQYLRKVNGVSVLIYDQTCALEKRRKRKRGALENPAKRVLINEKLCEGCGDCGVQSNCLSIIPLETEFGRKRMIDQSSCNKDFSCINGFCPSFVTVYGGELKKPKTDNVNIEQISADLPKPNLPDLEKPMSLLISGIGGNGVVTIGTILAIAAHLEDKGVTTMDQTGLMQKNGAVTSHIRIALHSKDIFTVRINAANADVVIGCDLLTTGDGDTLSRMKSGKTKIVLNTYRFPTGEFSQNPDWRIPVSKTVERVRNVCGAENLQTLDATSLVLQLLGDTIFTNMFMLGYAWQKGLVPVSQGAIMCAIEVNEVNEASIETNKQAFLWGRLAADDLEELRKHVRDASNQDKDIQKMFEYRHKSKTLDEVIERRYEDLKDYQNDNYASSYQIFVERVRETEHKLNPEGDYAFTNAVARNSYKLMAYKDEYEIARLYTDGSFKAKLEQLYEGNYKLKFNFIPLIWATRDPATGHFRKAEFGAWVLPVFKLLTKMRGLRGGMFDIFCGKKNRQARKLAVDYREMILGLLDKLNNDNYSVAIELAETPEQIRGFGHVKQASLEKAKAYQKTLLDSFENPEPKENNDKAEETSVKVA